MRRLPIFLVLDCSESMVGEKLRKMEEGLALILKSLRSDPYALEMVSLSAIAFAGKAETISPLTEVYAFQPPKLPLGGGTRLGAALECLMAEIDKRVARSSAERKGDWKPVVYLFTDGRPTDDPTRIIERWNRCYARNANLIAVSIGNCADLASLKRLTENVLIFENTGEEDFKRFFRWVSDSIVSQSVSVGMKNETTEMASVDPAIMRNVENLSHHGVDETCVTCVGRCSKNRRPYIIKYEKAEQAHVPRESTNLVVYDLVGCYPLDESYFSWSGSTTADLKINTNLLRGIPPCPHCGSPAGFAVCTCGHLLCLECPGEVICPWCGQRTDFKPVDDLEVGRGRG